MNPSKILQVESLSKTYGFGQSAVEALKGISFDVLEGEFLGIMGPSGCGKTTLLNCIATMTRPSSGRILLKGTDIAGFRSARLAEYRGKEMGYLFQEFELLDNLTIRENIILPLLLHQMTGSEAEHHLQTFATLLAIKDTLDKFPSQLSGGQKQRAAAARALIASPSIVLADEPTGSIDSKNARTLLDILSRINKDRANTIIMVTHDVNVASYCSRILFMQDGVFFHELRKHAKGEAASAFYERIMLVVTQLGGGSANVL